MKDRDIQTLLRMAREAEGLESGHAGDAPLFQLRPRPAVSLFRVGGLSAAAAALLLASLAAVHFMAPAPQPVRPGPGIYADRTARPAQPVQPATAKAARDSQSCVVLTMFRDGDECNCVQMKTHEIAGSLEELPRSELLSMGLAAPCSTSAQKVVVLAVTGKKEALPKTREDAEALAARIAASDSTHGGDVASAAYAAIPALGPGGTVVAETVAWKRPLPAELAGLLNR